MSNSTAYINFSSLDYTGANSLSTYALDLTPLTFVPNLSSTQHLKVVWDFGDGTISNSFSASKIYQFPGKYYVNLVVYDCNNNAKISTFEKEVYIHDYTPFTFEVLNLSGAYPTGSILGPMEVKAYYPPYQTVSPIFFSVSGSKGYNYWNLDSKFQHLENFYCFYDLNYNYAISSYQYREIPSIVPSVVNLYAKISNNSIVRCLSTDASASFIGCSGYKEVYFKNDLTSSDLRFDFWMDKTKNQISLYDNPNIDYLNNLKVSLSSVGIGATISKLSITSNGLDGEGYPISAFNIHPIKFFNTKIPFVVKLKDLNNFSIKQTGLSCNPLELSALNISLSVIGDLQLVAEGGQYLLTEAGEYIYASGYTIPMLTSQYNIESLNYTLSAQNHGGAFRGYVEFPYDGTTDLLQNVIIGVSYTDAVGPNIVYGQSNPFNVYSKNYYDIYKKNESFNASQTLMDLRFQETLLDKTILFEDFFGAVLGDSGYDHETVGTKLYEKISNFVANTQDIDDCEYEFIDSLAHFLGYNEVGEESYNYPEKVKRIISLASVNKNKLLGEYNRFKENLDIRGHTSKDQYGTNIGNQINPFTYIVDRDVPIVALEKFSNTYTLINTYKSDMSLYPLTDYSIDWGWPLVLPDNFNFSDIEKYYLFFEYVPGYDNTVIGGVVDFDNTKTTISRGLNNSELFGADAVFENMFLDTLYQSLSLTS
jgi:hypothetical protein